MTAAIATSRELKNKETGLDISVPEYREVSGLLTKYEEYHVIVITRLSHFKTIKNKMDDTVQFMVTKKYSDFEALHKTMTERFPATIFPDMPRKLFMMKDSTPQERRQCFDNIMRFIASNTKVCSCTPVLQFLGVNPDKITELENDQDSTQTDVEDSKSSASNSSWKRSNVSSSGSQQSSLFSDDAEDEFDIFKEMSGGPGNIDELPEEGDLFSTNSHTTSSLSAKKGVLLFSDSAADITDSDNTDGIYLPPGATADEKDKMVTRPETTKADDDADFLSMEDDFDQLLSDVLKKPDKPSPKPKPSPTKKPNVSSKDKPTPAQRPSPAARTAATSGKAPPKPAPRKGRPISKGETDTVAPVTKDTTSGKVAGAMDDGDILKYIQENAGDSEASLDLF